MTIPKFPMDKGIDYNYLARKPHESIRKVVDDSGVVEGGLLTSKIFAVSDWCRLPYYEADFGWGKPMVRN